MDKRPSDLWKDYLHENITFNRASQASFDTYLNKYSRKGTESPKEEIDDRFFIPGKIYSFVYTTSAKPDKYRPYINRRPILLSMGALKNESNGKIYEVGIDLMLVPFKVRIFLFDALYKMFKEDIDENDSYIKDGRKGKKALNLTYESAKRIFEKMGWQMAFQTYDKTKILQPNIYDYADWVTIVPLYNNGIEGKQPKEIYEQYIKQINNPVEPVNELTRDKKQRKK